jgi:cardiolipin synthase
MLTLPNFLTLLRLVAIPIFLALLAQGNHAVAFIVLLAAGVTDAVDGALARLTDTRSELGAVLDPMADKLLLLSSFVVLGFSNDVPRWLAALVVARDLIVVLGYGAMFVVHHAWMEVAPSRLGKLSTFCQLFTIGISLIALARRDLPLGVLREGMAWLTALTTAASGTQYVYRGLLWHQRQGRSHPGPG